MAAEAGRQPSVPITLDLPRPVQILTAAMSAHRGSSQSRTVRSWLHDSAFVPSSDTATSITMSVCPPNFFSSLRLQIRRQQQVVRLDVAVDHAARVGVMQTQRLVNLRPRLALLLKRAERQFFRSRIEFPSPGV
jgi:hypothetical protein